MRKRFVLIPVVLSVAMLAATHAVGAQTASTESGKQSPATTPADTKKHNFAKWEKAIAAFEKADREKMPAKGGILFVGSSTIVRWKSLEKDFPKHHVINRGFGGSEIVDSTHFAERMIFPYEPKMIMLRAGGNDIHAGKSAEQVFADFKDFVAKVHGKLPKTDIVFIGLCPAPSRWAERDTNKAVNKLVEEFVHGKPHLKYIETYNMSLDDKGEARPELFVADRLHFNEEGYKLLVERVRPYMPKEKD